MQFIVRGVLVDVKFRPKFSTLKGLNKELYNSNLN